MTIAQSARDGVPISGRVPADTISVDNARLTTSAFTIDVTSSGSGTAHIFLWNGDKGQIPVFRTSCSPAVSPAPDYGLSACALTDGGIPPWSPDMSGRVVRDLEVAVTAGKRTVSIPLDAAAYAKLSTNSSALISFETPQDEVQAFDVPLGVSGDVGGTVPATLSLTLGPAAAFGPFTAGVAKDYFAATTANVISTAGDALLSVADPSSNATGHLVNGAFSLPQPLQARATKAGTTGTAFNNVGSSASPLNLLTWDAPVSNDAVALEFKQSIGANDALRTGTYAKTLTFTLSTTMP